MPKLFLDYVGMGDSDKPKDYIYTTAERAWKKFRREMPPASTRLLARFSFCLVMIPGLVSLRDHLPVLPQTVA
jgi:hypothetical protein